MKIKKNKDEKDNSLTKSSSDFDYLMGYNLSYSSFSNSIDEAIYGNYFYENYFIPQGLSKDFNGNLLISMYDKLAIKHPIVVRYNPTSNTIINVYTLTNMDPSASSSHVGGIGYYRKYSNTREFIFVSHGNNIIVYTPSFINARILNIVADYPIKHWSSAVSTSHGYLWVAKHRYSGGPLSLTGYKIINSGGYSLTLGKVNSNGDMILDSNGNIIPNFDLLQPKIKIQGLYCDSNPEVEKRFKFYFVRSSPTYVYQAILVTKDINNDGVIAGTNEYYWESYFTPNIYYITDSTVGDYIRKFPQGGEGIVMKDNKLWMINEGATNYYCDDWWYNKDCKREILIIDSAYANEQTITLFPSGSIQIKGTGIDNWGYKVAIILAQNKKGNLYYTIGQFGSRNNRIYLKKPSSINPIGKIFEDYVPRVFIEDIKGVYFMNLNEYGSNGNSDDFYLTKLNINYDEIRNSWQDDSQDDFEYINVYESFGDDNTSLSSGDKEAMFLSFDLRWGANDIGRELFFNSSSGWHLYSDIFIKLRECYDDWNTDAWHNTCMIRALDDIELYFSIYGYGFLLNQDINRFYDIQ